MPTLIPALTPFVAHVVHGALAVAGVCTVLIAVLLPLCIRREKRKAQQEAARLNARVTMEQHWTSQATDGRTLMMDGEALRRVWDISRKS